MRRALLLFAVLLVCCPRVHAVELRISAQAIERTLRLQLFTAGENRYYMKGDAHSACFVYAEDPKVSFKDDRIVVHVRARAKLGTGAFGSCLGVGLSRDADVSVVPEAEDESIGFRDARIEKLSDSSELNFLLTPFLSRRLPQAMKINAADLLRALLTKSSETTGYSLTLDRLKIHSMVVQGGYLVVDVDGGIRAE
jgi:hypothetical protein